MLGIIAGSGLQRLTGFDDGFGGEFRWAHGALLCEGSIVSVTNKQINK